MPDGLAAAGGHADDGQAVLRAALLRPGHRLRPRACRHAGLGVDPPPRTDHQPRHRTHGRSRRWASRSPPTMVGRPVFARPDDAPLAEKIATLSRMDTTAGAVDKLRDLYFTPVFAWFAVICTLLALLASFRRTRWLRSRLRSAAAAGAVGTACGLGRAAARPHSRFPGIRRGRVRHRLARDVRGRSRGAASRGRAGGTGVPGCGYRTAGDGRPVVRGPAVQLACSRTRSAPAGATTESATRARPSRSRGPSPRSGWPPTSLPAAAGRDCCAASAFPVVGAVVLVTAAAPFAGANAGVAIWGVVAFAVAWLRINRIRFTVALGAADDRCGGGVRRGRRASRPVRRWWRDAHRAVLRRVLRWRLGACGRWCRARRSTMWAT